MERRPAMMWTCLLGACLVSVPPGLTLVPRRAPQLLSCVFQQRANITCHWDSGDTQSFNTTNYTLQIEKMMPQGNNSSPGVIDTFSCSSSNTSCTVNINNSNIAFTFCITVTAHSLHHQPVKSDPRCQSGRKEVKLLPVNLSTVEPVIGRPRCLNFTWVRPLSYAASMPEIESGNLTSQIEVTSQVQPGVQRSEVIDVKVLATSFEVCLFRPYTLYSIRLRHHFHGSTAPWSEWSNRKEGKTGEDAPSAAPAFWRQVKETIKNGWRRVLLLWKPLPHFQANGEVCSYNVTCRSENAPVLNDGGSCQDLNKTRTSCSWLLPPESCTCLLSVSNKAGTSTEAQIWLPGVSETELPSPNQVTANPLDDNRVEVRWTAPADQAVSGFVVEWFAVTESKSSCLHWDRVNSSCTAVVITEGVKPMERYAISVKALYDERGTGQSRLLYIYTHQGAPTAGPKLEVQISANRVELSWNPIPVEKQRGYIRNYTLYYTPANEPPRKVYVPGDVTHYALQNLLPGNYDIYMQANTDAGTGVEGPKHNVYIGSEDVSWVMKCVILPFILTSLGLVLMACLAQNEMVKQKLCQDIPDPSHSSLAHWMPKTPLENMKWLPMAEKPKIQYSEITLVGESELQNMGQDFGYHSACIPQTYLSHPYSSLPYAGAQKNPHNTRGCDREHIRSPPKTPAKTTNTSTAEHDSPTASLTSSCCVYSHILPSQPPLTLLQPLLSYSQLQPSDWQYITVSAHDSKPQPGGESELPASTQGETTRGSDSPLSETDRLEINPLTVAEKTGLALPSALQSLSLRQHHTPLSRCNLRNVSHSSFSLPHSVEVSSPALFFSPGHINSVPPLQPDPFSYPISLSNSFSTSLSPLHHPIPVDLSYSLLSGQFSVDCDPYISSDV